VTSLLGLITLAGLTFLGCAAIADLASSATAQPCEQLYSERRCLAIADAATAFSDRTRDDVGQVLIVPSAPPEDGELQTLGGATPITVRIVMQDGTTSDTNMCGGIPSGPACADAPQPWDLDHDLVGGGYHDVPAGSSPIPSIDPRVVGGGVPIEVASRTIPVDHVGPHEVSLGIGALPNGILTQATYRLPDPWATDVTFASDASPRLVLRSLESDGRPFDNAYAHGWREDVERIEALLVFDVKRLDPGAVIEVRDVIVR